MPFSQSSQISTIVGYAQQLQPGSVLDVGTGMGQYGFLLRTNLENVNLFDIDGSSARQRHRSQWAVRIDGIEGYATYLTPVHEYAYNQVLVGNALDLLPTLADRAYELVLAIDILEHLSTDDGKAFLAHCTRIASRAVLVSTPKVFVPQDVPANPLEDHRSVWTERELQDLGFTSTLPNDESWVVVHSRP
ncbi:MAG: class I SAM-dependent methyltransferase [Rubrivivax sp.]|nr:class I SAM-dependent methyltransferase [Rubrivivax sp.]